MTAAHIDYETRSELPLQKVGLSRYARDLSTTVLCMAWSLDDGPVTLWKRGERFPDAVLNADEIHAHNASFESAISEHVLHWQPHSFRCSATHAAAVGLPRALDAACDALHLGIEGKDKAGQAIMRKTCQPDKNGNWVEDEITLEKLYAYCRQDTVAEMNLEQRLPDVHPNIWRDWTVTQKINQRGVPIDRELCEGAVAIMDAAMSRSQTIADALTGGEIKTGGQIKKILQFVNERNVNINDLQAETVDYAIKHTTDPDALAMLELRQSVAGAAVKKYPAILNRVDDDNRLREVYMNFGAHTGRYSSPGVQIQNLKIPPKGFITDELIAAIKTGDLEFLESLYDVSAIQLLGNAVRAAICAPEGRQFVLADFSQIEVRIAHWLAGNTTKLQQFEQGLDAYIDFGRDFFHTKDVTPEQRQYSKAPVLGGQYGMGGSRLVDYAEQYGVELSDPEAKDVVTFYRSRNQPIVNVWKNIETAAVQCVATGKSYKGGKLIFRMEGAWCTMQLPSGRKMFYYKPVLKVGRYGPVFSYQDTKGGRSHLWGGSFLENACQAITADFTNEAAYRAEQEDLEVVINQHDEIGVECDDADGTIAELTEIMKDRPSWASDLPIDVETRVRTRFLK